MQKNWRDRLATECWWCSYVATGVLIAALSTSSACDSAGDTGFSNGWDADNGWEEEEEGPIERGAADNNQDSGRQDRGQDPGSGEVTVEEDPDNGTTIWSYEMLYSSLIIAPDGNNLLANVPKPGPKQGFDDPGVVLAVQPLPSGKPVILPQLQDSRRINFSPNGKFAYLLSGQGTQVREVDLQKYSLTGDFVLPSPYSVIDVSADGRYLIATNLPKSDLEEKEYNPYSPVCSVSSQLALPAGASYCTAGIVDLMSGVSWEIVFPQRLRDVDFEPVDGNILISYSLKQGGQEGNPQSFLVFYNPEQAQVVAKLQFENCSDEVVISEATEMALQSPTICALPADFDPRDPMGTKESSAGGQEPTWGGSQGSFDPISIINLKTREFVKNLPGFGPVALSEAGDLVAGFTLRQVMKDEWDYQAQVDPVGIIFVHLPSLDWDVIDVGSAVPAYVFSPDGQFLYLYNDNPLSDNTVGRIDVATYNLEWLTGPSVDLDAFVWSPSGTQLFTLTEGKLFHISNDSSEIRPVTLPVPADLINIRPQGDYFLVGPRTAPLYHLLPIPDDETELPVVGEFDLQLTAIQ